MYYGDNFKIECPTGSGKMMNLFEVCTEIANRLIRIFTQNEKGWRPTNGVREKCQTDPYWKDYVLFYEYFHGDTGAGIGASHQTGWTGLVAPLIELYGAVSAQQLIKGGKQAAFVRGKPAPKIKKKPAVALRDPEEKIMMIDRFFRNLPFWGLFLITVLGLLISIEAGLRLGR